MKTIIFLVQTQYTYTYGNVELMHFKFDDKMKRIHFVWHIIAVGKFLKPDTTSEEDTVQVYEKNIDMYGYDVDELYGQVRNRN